jgi:hypothetical protein
MFFISASTIFTTLAGASKPSSSAIFHVVQGPGEEVDHAFLLGSIVALSYASMKVAW